MGGIVLTLIVVIITLWFLWRKRKLSLFKRLNIPGPEPSLIFGNYWEIYHEGKHNCIKKWIKQYGRVFGYYFGLRPVLIVADLDLLRVIQMKEFHKFPNRPKLFEVGTSTSEFNKYSITTAQAQKWKDLRTIITPTFTTAKLKMMNSITKDSVNELYDAVEKNSANGKAFDIYPLYQNLTMDVIARTSLGIHTNAQTDKNEPFVKLSRMIMSLKSTYLEVLAFSFAELMNVFSLIRRAKLSWENKGRMPRGELQERTAEVIKMRRSDQTTRRRDVLQLMMDAQRTVENVNDSSLTAGENDDHISDDIEKPGDTKNGVKLTDNEVLHNAVLFLLAGYETTSTALAFITHCLVKYRDIQDKVREEIKSIISNSNDISYEVVHNLPYLDRFVNEALRFYPPITYFVNRQAVEDTVIDGLRIPKDVAIQIPVHYIHHDPEIWENPEKFDTERFTKEAKSSRHPLAFQAFGAGPRNCIGMRFALTEIKMALVKLLFHYKFLPKEGNTQEEIEVRHTVVIDRPEIGVFIRVEKD